MGDGMAKTILVIDDDPAVLQAYGRLLRRLGHRVALLADATRAGEEIARLGGADLLILDQRMPLVSGLEIIAGLGSSGGRAPAILLISGFLSEDLKLRARQFGVTEVIEKPVNPENLLRSVRQALASVSVREGAPGGSP